MASRLPRIPQGFYSALGEIPVSIDAEMEEKENKLGEADFSARRIRLAEAETPQAQWQVLWHELVHVALWDGGIQQSLTHDQMESVCDTLGTYLTAAMLNGYLKVPARRAR